MATLQHSGQIRSAATFGEAEDAIRRLDGTAHTLVRLERTAASALTIGGGPRHFVVELTESPSQRWCAVDPSQGPAAVRLVVDGSPGDYQGYFCLNLEAALEAARTFLESDGERSARLIWSMKT